MKRVAAALACLAAASCAGSGAARGLPGGEGPLVGVYRASIDDGSGATRHARLLLWAERPDRLHAELLSPVGGVRFVLDAGGGAACVVDVADATAYSGDAGPAAFEGLVGVRVSIAEAVAALLTGSPPAGVRVERGGGVEGELPARFVLAEGARVVELTRVRFERGTSGRGGLGTGQAPPGLAVRPLRELPAASGALGESGGDR